MIAEWTEKKLERNERSYSERKKNKYNEEKVKGKEQESKKK